MSVVEFSWPYSLDLILYIVLVSSVRFQNCLSKFRSLLHKSFDGFVIPTGQMSALVLRGVLAQCCLWPIMMLDVTVDLVQFRFLGVEFMINSVITSHCFNYIKVSIIQPLLDVRQSNRTLHSIFKCHADRHATWIRVRIGPDWSLRTQVSQVRSLHLQNRDCTHLQIPGSAHGATAFL